MCLLQFPQFTICQVTNEAELLMLSVSCNVSLLNQYLLYLYYFFLQFKYLFENEFYYGLFIQLQLETLKYARFSLPYVFLFH